MKRTTDSAIAEISRDRNSPDPLVNYSRMVKILMRRGCNI
jgi:hypothetical protein